MNDFTTPQSSESLSLMDAASALEPDSPEDGQEDDSGTQETELEVEAQAETEEPVDESDDESEDEFEDSDSDEEDEESDSQEPDYQTVKVDGKDTQVTLDELKLGYSRTQDYTRKTQELANQRKAMEQEFEAVRMERQQYAQLLNQLQSQLQTEKEPDWDTLRQQDPIEYSIQVADWQRKSQMREAANAEQARLMQLQQVEQQKVMAQMIQKAQERLATEIPGWTDKEKSKLIKAQVREQGQKLGFSEQELQQVYDPRAVLAIHKAAMYDQLMAKKANLKPEKPQSKTLRSGKKSSGERMDVSRAKSNLNATGDIRSAVALLNLMGK